MNRRPFIYLSGPITLGDRQHNLDQFLLAHKVLMLAGATVYDPGPSMLIPGAFDIPHEVWIEADLEAIRKAQCVVVLPGESRGSEQEVAFAQMHKPPIPVIRVGILPSGALDFSEAVEWIKQWRATR